MKKSNYHHGNLKNAMIEKGLEILKEEGFKNLSLRKVSEKIGVSPSATYRHFKDSESLIAEIAMNGFQKLIFNLEEVIKKRPRHYLFQIREAGLVYIIFAIQNKELFRIMYGSSIVDHSYHPILKEKENEAFLILVNIIKNAQLKNLIIQKDPSEIALSAWSIVHGFAVLYSEKQIGFSELNEIEIKRKAKKIIQYLFTGVLQRKDF